MRKMCKHYKSPIHNEECALGINYLKLAGETRFGYLSRIPCVRGTSLSKEGPLCDKVEYKTEAEEKAEEEAFKEHASMLMKAIGIIKETKKMVGKIECPKCKSTLHFSIAKSNGHIWGKCDTPKCLNWVQ